MKLLFVIGLWIVFVLLTLYTVLSWKKEDMAQDNDTIRKVWYLIFVFGFLVYITNEQGSLFFNCKSHLIALIGFIVVDSLVFLNLYFIKFIGHKLKVTEKQINETQHYLELTNNKFYNMGKVLNSYDYPGYTIGEPISYTRGMKQ